MNYAIVRLNRPQTPRIGGLGDRVLILLASRLKPTAIYFQWRPQLKDPKDEMVLECAINAGARGIVTFNEPIVSFERKLEALIDLFIDRFWNTLRKWERCEAPNPISIVEYDQIFYGIIIK